MYNIKITKGNLLLEYKRFIFPGGEVGVKLDANNLRFFYREDKCVIVARVQNSDDFIALAMIKNALEQRGENDISLFIPYFPYGRQDRVCDDGESFSLKVFAHLINSLDFKTVTIVDPHSEVCPALINNINVISQFSIIHRWDYLISKIANGIIVSPDSGANKKSAKIASYLNHYEFVRADKLRDLTNGNIKETIVYYDDFKGRDVVIIDDLCDAGRTFIELAKVLKTKNAGKVMLYITHGIFSRGTKPLFEGGIDEIYTTNSYYGVLPGGVELKPENIFNVENFLTK